MGNSALGKDVPAKVEAVEVWRVLPALWGLWIGSAPQSGCL